MLFAKTAVIPRYALATSPKVGNFRSVNSVSCIHSNPSLHTMASMMTQSSMPKFFDLTALAQNLATTTAPHIAAKARHPMTDPDPLVSGSM